MIDPVELVFFKPSNLSRFKSELFDRVGARITASGGKMVRGDVETLEECTKAGLTPVVGCMPELTDFIRNWRSRNRNVIYWDRGYLRRIFATWLPRAESGSGYYRYTINGFQSQRILDVPNDRWKALRIDVQPWQKGGRHILIAAPTRTYARFHRIESWIADTIDALARVTDRQLVIRDKETKRPLQADLKDAHCLVTHGSIAAVEAVVLGYPVFVDPSSAAALVGRTSLKDIERPVYPDRQPWLNSLAYSQFDEAELINGKLWQLLQ